ncbi:MAG: DNA polymerase III subunit alpha [Breznakibacter sp.]
MDFVPYVHLHVHSQYSILDGAASIKGLVQKAKTDGMPALALTDHGNMFGIKEFWDVCKKEGIKPILGCETYVATKSRLSKNKDEKEDRSGDHLILLAKNHQGYKNLLKLISIANTEGYYYKPRVDKEILELYHEGLIVTSACLGGEVPQKIMSNDLDGARDTIAWFKRVFGDDYYLELQLHPNDDPRLRAEIYDNQRMVNEAIMNLAKEFDVKVVATNDVHFINAEDADAHDLLICLNTGKDLDDPNRMRYTKQEWFKTTAEMNALFDHVPTALRNTVEIAEKVETYDLNSKPIMPDFPLPEGFSDEGEYLKHITYEGAYKRYGNPLPDDVKERIDFELNTIIGMGFPGYFLIVQDFINAARRMGVLVGPGRGSAAGAAVSYCTGITNVDPIRYDLLFERFLNPDRISMPDVDIDFDDDGRQLVLDYVTDKYGHDKVAHICTFGTMAAKMAIRDVARVLKLPLPEADRLAKMVPETPKITLKKAYEEVPDLEREKSSSDPLIAKTIKFAETLEGSVRQTGVHACGILISKDPLDEHIPVMPTKDENLLTTQYDGRFVEAIGLMKMDFLGLKTLSIIKETLENIKLSKGVDVDVDNIPPDDIHTFELFSRGETTAIFQFESPGMKKHLRALQPNRFEDLVAMNALYRPGPMEYIPSFVNRKHGKEDIKYDHPMMESYLKDTYGITVYQEQVMLQSRALGNFTRGDSDTLRKAMGKKQIEVMNKLKEKFLKGCLDNPGFMTGCGNDKKKASDLVEKIWKDWEAFASYAFNKSHSVCYAYVAYQTGYLKAHYPAEFMAGVLSCNLSDITKITNFMEECKLMGLNVLGPDVNESFKKFTVNKNGAVRFGMAGIKGVGEGAVEEIINERQKNGPYKDIFDFVQRVNLTTVNKKNLEALSSAGAFDNLGNIHRAQFFASAGNDDVSFIEYLIRYGNRYQTDKSSNQNSLFGALGGSAVEIKKPDIPRCEEFSTLEKLNREKELIGIYLSAHPLDDYRLELTYFCNTKLKEFEDLFAINKKEIVVGGMITNVRKGVSKKGSPYAIITLEDYSGPYEIPLFGADYPKFSPFTEKDIFVMIRGNVIPKRFNQEEREFKISHIDLLSEVRAKKVDSITLSIPLAALTQTLVTELADMTSDVNGEVILKFNIYDPVNNNQIRLFSRNKRVNLTNDLLKYFEENQEIRFDINS